MYIINIVIVSYQKKKVNYIQYTNIYVFSILGIIISIKVVEKNMCKKLSKIYDASKYESEIYEYWLKNNFFLC